jgi:two-component system nitrogen regulation sensor histidine kinase NtrY
LAPKLNPYAFNRMNHDNKSQFVNSENIGNLNYLSAYSFISTQNRSNLAILQIPYISANTEIKSETSTIIITLINIFVLLFLLSSAFALFLTNSVTQPFRYIVKQFTKINLSKTNEPLHWQYSDEIGLLVKEYNRMLRKLENSTVLLAKTEREMAWREMAKQVAHEIKNPLTPMKLSLQMLERAIKNNNPNIDEITARVTNTLIEQIDNLTLIATNFSNFAKMPEMKKEYFNLNDVLYAVTGMYNDDQENEFLFLIPDYNIIILADKSQLIRVFTNIIQNAIQSIPSTRKGNIALQVTKVVNNNIRVTISDNGEGIDKEKAEKLFQPYFTTKSSGTGLGLAMCKDILEQFGGRIWFESKLNEGSSFHIELPTVTELLDEIIE